MRRRECAVGVERGAEDEGFEPSIGFPIHAFQACALGRYANPPASSPGEPESDWLRVAVQEVTPDT